MIRFLDIVLSSIGLFILAPVFLIIAIAIKVNSKGPVFYLQNRVGKQERIFKLFKFRSMRVNADRKGLLTIGNDSRITSVGKFIRQYKIDELPQLFNVIKGDMSLVGPRPEVEKYTRLYNPEQKKLLLVRPGITDPASLFYKDESSILAKSNNPEQTYINQVLPHKLTLSISYALHPTPKKYFKFIFLTIFHIIRPNK